MFLFLPSTEEWNLIVNGLWVDSSPETSTAGMMAVFAKKTAGWVREVREEDKRRLGWSRRNPSSTRRLGVSD